MMGRISTVSGWYGQQNFFVRRLTLYSLAGFGVPIILAIGLTLLNFGYIGTHYALGLLQS